MGKAKITHARQIPAATVGRHTIADSQGLTLIVNAKGSRSFTLSMMHKGERYTKGLGSYPAVGLKGAKEKAALMRAEIIQGASIIAKGGAVPVTFKNAADTYIRLNKDKWSCRVHEKQWNSTLKTYAYPVIGDMLVSEITRDDIVEFLKPIWSRKHETARVVLGRIALVLDLTIAQNMRDGNPARDIGPLKMLLGAVSRKVVSHASMHHSQILEFMTELRATRSVSSSALEFTILTASRTTEVLEAQWAEIDLDNAVWVIPAERMKARREHKVPLSPRAIEILEEVQGLDDNWVFPSISPGRGTRVAEKPKPLSNMAMLNRLKRMRPKLTVHGFRATFRTWASETCSYPHEVCEAALAHTISDKTVAAYLRTTYLDERRSLMNEWAAFTQGQHTPSKEDDETAAMIEKLKASGLPVEDIIKKLLT